MNSTKIGIVYGRLTVKESLGRDKRSRDMWLCACECGTVKAIRGDHLRAGAVKSCGCLSKEKARETARATGRKNLKHGGDGTKLYSIWHNIKCRCLTPSHKAYKHYGGRGVSICAEWVNDFAKFREWALNNGYKQGLSIDRINNDKGYSPTNCRWATPKEQSRNTRSNVRINGKCLSEWCERAVVSGSTVSRRLAKGWDIISATSTPPLRRAKHG